MMATMSIRGIDELAVQRLKRLAEQQGVSMNRFVISILSQRVGLQAAEKKQVWHDLNHLAGTWTQQDEEAFNRNTTSVRLT